MCSAISQARISIRLAVTSTKITSVIVSTITKADKEKKNHKDREVHKEIFLAAMAFFVVFAFFVVNCWRLYAQVGLFDVLVV